MENSHEKLQMAYFGKRRLNWGFSKILYVCKPRLVGEIYSIYKQKPKPLNKLYIPMKPHGV